MKTYLVGGAVRDQLLGLPFTEKDWVVVGATEDELRLKGYKQVGSNFPVYLHPKTGEEYALARTERKTEPGYYGFSCDFHPGVTLDEDLFRRDITINAMAMDENGDIIDPFNGQADLKARVLRHVSDAFVEDPVRVLRVARFAAKFYHLGFKLADETRCLMYSMVQNKELEYLVAERVWQEWQKSLLTDNPEIFITTLRACGALRVILPELDALFGVPATKAWHFEVDSGVHSLMVLNKLSSLTTCPITRFAALVHDLGKALTPMQDWPKQKKHEHLGIPIIEQMCARLRIPVAYSRLAKLVSRFHLTIHRVDELSAQKVVEIFEQTDAFRRPELFKSLLQVCEADGLNSVLDPCLSNNLPWFFPRSQVELNYPQTKLWNNYLEACCLVDVKDIIAKGYTKDAIRTELHRMRVKKVKDKT